MFWLWATNFGGFESRTFGYESNRSACRATTIAIRVTSLLVDCILGKRGQGAES